MISNGFMYWIFFALCKLLYGVIPGLYDAFEFFGTYQFFDLDNDIKTIWGNLYVLLSVLVLFAIAIKLINAIVNPDVLDDKKNGVKKVFIKAFVAVFLTVLTPYMFTLLVDVQENIFTNKTIDKIFFNASGNQNTGHVIAWTAITSFINLDELAEVTATTNHAYNLDTSAVSEGSTSNSHIYILSEDVDVGLNNIYKSQPWQYTDTVHQNPILMLLAGAFIVYEFILLVMDTALRSIKLGILQMMTPIILGAYIFKEDILKKWALEYIKTFVQVFLLLISISLMTKVLSLLPNIMAGPNWPNNPSWLLIGIINTLAIMATLRLVHQIIPLINKIFGTNIEGKGGIRGRLGEMAVVGGLAQRAWDSFRQNPARALTAPVSAVGGALAHNVAAGNRARLMLDTAAKRRNPLNWVNAAGAVAGGLLTTGGAAVRGARQGWQYGNIRAIGAQGRRYEDTHKNGSTLVGRTIDDFRETVGLESREAVFARNAEKVQKARNALNASYQQAQQLATSEYSNQSHRVTGLTSAAGSRYNNGNLTAYQMSQAISDLREVLGNTTDTRIRNQIATDIQTLGQAYDAHVNTVTRDILNAASRGENLADTRPGHGFVSNPGNIQVREFTSSIQNSIIENIGAHDANTTMEAGTGVGSLERVEAGLFGTNLDRMINAEDRALTTLTQQYAPGGVITARGRANADQRSRDNRYVDNAKPNHGGGNNGS